MRLTDRFFSTLLLVAVLILAGCQSETEVPSEQQHIFGNGTRDFSRVLARVNGYDITETMLNLRLDELPLDQRSRFESPEGRRLYLRRMVDEALVVQDAAARKLDRDPVVARVLISERRDVLALAQRTDLIKDKEPDIDAVRAFFARNRDKYTQLGRMQASHVECLTREDAEEVYRLLTEERHPMDTVAKTHSVNNTTKVRGGLLGFFNPGGFIDGIIDSRDFTTMIWDLNLGFNPPFEFRDRWHVVLLHERIPPQQASLEDVYRRVLMDMQTEFQNDLVDRWKEETRAAADIQFFGEFRPGQGMSADQLMERAFYLKDVQQQLDLLTLLADDYPQSELADKALLMAATIAMNNHYDHSTVRYYLSELLRRYPESEVAEDARYVLENLNQTGFAQPRSIEDLRKRR